MKRIILMIALSIAASIALAGDNPATYNTKTGRLDIPAVIVDGGPINYSVAFEKADAPATTAHINAFRLLPESVALAEDPSAPDWLFVQTAATAELVSTTTLVVPFQQDVFAFTDRPYRQHAYLNATQFVSLWTGAGSDSFQADPPNAVLTWADGGVVKEAQVELLDAKLSINGTHIAYTVNWLTSRYNIPYGTALKSVSLFFDVFDCHGDLCREFTATGIETVFNPNQCMNALNIKLCEAYFSRREYSFVQPKP